MGFFDKPSAGNKTENNTRLGAHEDGAVYVKRGRIEKATYSENVGIGSKGAVADVVVGLDIDTGAGFAKSTTILGWFKKIATAHGEVASGLGSLFKVKQLIKATGTDNGKVLQSAGIEASDLDEKNFNESAWRNLFDAAVKEMVGQEVVYLEYAAYQKNNGKTGYDVYDIFYSAGDDDEAAQKAGDALYKSFMKQVEGGWVKRYDPTLLNAGGDSAQTEAPSFSVSSNESEDVPF